jgi:sec-independent protein translocase protein TatB
MLDLGIGGGELVVIAVIALIVVGPKDLPLLLRRVGQFTAKLRGMASEFRASFDEMARQSELDELRKEVEALRRGDPLKTVRDEIEPAMREIENDVRAETTDYGANYQEWAPSTDAYGDVPPGEPRDEEPHDATADAPPPEVSGAMGVVAPASEVAPDPVTADGEPVKKRRTRARKSDAGSAA